MDSAEYCREIEAHLCRRNDGHLVRISGPAFEMVCRWAALGVPFKVACQGIDRHLQRGEQKTARRRPVRIEFCEADVLDAFDAWRRAVGVRVSLAGTAAPGGGDDGGEADDTPPSSRRRTSLAAHIDRAINRLTSLRTGPSVSSVWDSTLDDIVRRLDAMFAGAKTARGPARDAIEAELSALDAAMMDAARERFAGGEGDDIRREAEAELAPFAGRMPAQAYRDAFRRCTDRVIRERLALPSLGID